MIDLRLRGAFLECLDDVLPGSSLVVGVSGGADSLALLRAATFTARSREWRVAAVIVDHQLQPGSAQVAERTRQLCAQLEASEVRVVRVAVDPMGVGLEAAARTARRAALEQVAAELAAPVILLGHTLDDQAETVLLGLARGSGARSLSGMRQIDGLYRRPFLNVARSLVRDSVADLDAHEDPHNSDRRFARARVRSVVLPTLEADLGPGVADALARSADMLRDDADALDALALNAITDVIEVLIELPRAIRTRILRRLALDSGCPANDLTRDHVLGIDALVTRWRGQGPLDLPGAVKCQRQGGRLTFYRDDVRSST